MRVSREDRIAGLPAAAARELMRRFRNAQPERMISQWTEPDGRSDAEIARALAADGWLEVTVTNLDGEAW